VASRALHPSVGAGDAPLAAVIAEGLAAAMPTWDVPANRSAAAGGRAELLRTTSYAADLVRVPEGGVLVFREDADVELHAVAVVAGVLVTADGRSLQRGASCELDPRDAWSWRAAGGPVSAVVVAWRTSEAQSTAA